MANIQRRLDDRLTAAIRGLFPDAGDAPAIVMQAQDERFGDYQANGAMALAKRLGKNPRDVAAEIVAAADLSDVAENMEIAGPGFINITLSPDWLASQLAEVLADKRLGVPSPARHQTIVVDYSAPNLAKEMHVGHLRSTIIGDALVRVLEFLGHDVKRQNHVGDWGRQFGVVILGIWHLSMARARGDEESIRRDLKKLADLRTRGDEQALAKELARICQQHQADLQDDPEGTGVFYLFITSELLKRSLDDLLVAYRFVTLVETLAQGRPLEIYDPKYNVTTPLSEVSRRVTTYLQAAQDPANNQEYEAWRSAKRLTLESCASVYRRLGVLLEPSDVCGESFYDARSRGTGGGAPPSWDVSNVVQYLRSAGLLEPSDRAQCVFLDEFKAKDGSPLPLIVQKSDEGYLYATTDLAAVRSRVDELKADRILYVVDARQSLHFRMMFAVAKAAGFAPQDVSLEHVGFGMMLGSDNRPFKTREGGTVKLMDLIDEAERRAFDLVTEKNRDLPEPDRRRIARVVGIGALKYADLAQNRTKDYVFSWNKMLSLDGNTAPYMQYAFARIHSIARKGGVDLADLVREPAADEGFALAEPAERRLAVALLQFAETVETVAADCLPHVLCGYLYRLAGAFMGFYETCPVLKAEQAVRASRLRLCALTAKVIEKGLNLLGIETAERM